MKLNKTNQIWVLAMGILILLFLRRLETKETDAMDRIAIALKTGRDVVLQRVPIQLVTYLKKAKALLVIGDNDGTIGSYDIINVCTQKSKRSVERLFENQTSTGWINDAQKNIPGYAQLYTRFPDKDWYVMVDDDTYIFFENLVHFLEGFDPLRPWYFGMSTNFIGCDDVSEYGTGPLFAHGGSGIVLSRKAIELLVKESDRCIEKYSSCWAGDVRLALCLRDVGVHVDGRGEFHENPPNDEFNYQSPCVRPLSFHHLLPHQFQTLYDIETRSNRTNLSDIAPYFLSKELKMDTDRPGHDYRTFYEPTGHECYEQCLKDPKCMAFSFQKSLCSLKSSIPSQVAVIGSISGIVLDHFRCK